MRVENQYKDVLQNIEFGIILIYKDHPALSDYEVMRALEALIDSYVAEKIGRNPRKLPSSDVEHLLYNSVRRMCEWRLGRSLLGDDLLKEKSLPLQPKTVDEILLCLKRILKSVNKWNRHRGTQGYLQFVSKFVK